MILKIALGLVALIALVVVYAALQPSSYSISRSAEFKASPEAIFPWLNNSKKAGEWMPWSAMDPKMKMSFSGPEEGVGSQSAWTSDGKMGVGSATVVESTPNQSVKTKLVYTKPFEGEQLAEISITPAAGGSVVKWSVTGKNNLVSRIFCMFMNMDKMIGGSFEAGLANLKQKVGG
jgi:hypothetical protein